MELKSDITIHQLHNKLNEHISEQLAYREDYEWRERSLLNAQEINTKNIAALTDATKGLVDAWNTANAIRRFAKWVSGMAVTVGIIYAWSVDLIQLGY